MKNTMLISGLILAVLLWTGCGDVSSSGSLTGDYLGQTPPGKIAQLFAPGVVSTGMDDRDFTISPDLNTICWGITEKPHNVIVTVSQKEGRWNAPKLLPFCGAYDDVEAQFTADGNRIWFATNRPESGQGDPIDFNLWYVDKEEQGWSRPVKPGSPLNSDKNEFYPSAARSGALYFTTHDMKIARAAFFNGQWQTPEVLSDSINSGVAEYNAFVDPDERFLVFTSHAWGGSRRGRGDLVVSFQKPDGSWTTPKNLGPNVNSPALEYCPHVTPDGKYLFFASLRTTDEWDPEPVRTLEEVRTRCNGPGNRSSDIYWVDASVIWDLCPAELK